MRGVKLTTAIVTIIEGIFGIIGGILIALLGVIGESFLSGFSDVFSEAGLDLAGMMGIFIVVGLIVVAVSVILLILGIKFCSRKPNKGIAITLLVFYALGALSFLTNVTTGIVSVAMLALTIVYLVLLGKQNNNYPNDSNY